MTEFPIGAYIRFTADWCGPCKNYNPVWDEFVRAHPSGRHFVVDVDKQPDLARIYNIRSIPSVVLITEDGFEKIDDIYSLR